MNNTDFEHNMNKIEEIIEISGKKIHIENGLIKNILNENNKKTEYVDVDTVFDIINKEIDKIYK